MEGRRLIVQSDGATWRTSLNALATFEGAVSERWKRLTLRLLHLSAAGTCSECEEGRT
ncbi:MAG: hypothetical protein ACTS46_00885 [Candidatus Hodgkinia cicadicola]